MTTKAKKLNGESAIMIPAAMFLDMARVYKTRAGTEGVKFYAEMAGLESKAYRKVQEAKRVVDE